MAKAVHSTTASVIPFPLKPPRRPSLSADSIFERDGYDRAFVSVRVAEQFVGTADGETTLDLVSATMRSGEELGPQAIARVLEHNAQAIGFLRSALAFLVDADLRIAEAADAALGQVPA